VDRKLRRKLSHRPSIRLLAKFRLGSKLRRERVKLKELLPPNPPSPPPGGRSPKRHANIAKSGGTWNRGDLTCYRYILRVHHPPVSATGHLVDTGFYNNTNYWNYVNFTADLYTKGHGWLGAFDPVPWSGWIAVQPWGTTSSIPTYLGNPPQGRDLYMAGISQIRWWNQGYNQWNWVLARAPYFGYEVRNRYWCHIP
jgi:hypothetical protein